MVGVSCTSPSVSRIAPAKRLRGMSAKARSMALNRLVPVLPPSGTVTVRSSRPGSFSACCTILPRAASVSRARSPICMDAVWSTTSSPISASPTRLSCTSSGPESHSSSTAKPAMRSSAPRALSQNAGISASTHRPPSSPISQTGTSGESRMAAIACSTLLPQPLQDLRHVDLVAFVVAGQCVHHQVDAKTIGQQPLPSVGRAAIG